MIVPRPLLNLREAAAEVRVSESTMRSWVREGVVPAIRIGRRGDYRIDPDELRDAVARPAHEPGTKVSR